MARKNPNRPSRGDRIAAIDLHNYFQRLGLKTELKTFEDDDESFQLIVDGLPGKRGFLLSTNSGNRPIGTQAERFWFFFHGTDADDGKPWTYTRDFASARTQLVDLVNVALYGRAQALRMRPLVAGARSVPGPEPLPLPGGRSRKNPAVMPVRASNMAKFGLPMQRGGVYLEPRSRENLTGRVYAGGFIDVTGPRPTFIASDAPDTMPDRRGRLVTKVNLFKQLGKWRWVGAGRPTSVIEDTPVLVSVQNTHGHFYALRVDFETPMQLATYPQQRDEPRLRPTAHAREMTTGHTVGEIVTNARSRHAVYDRITLR